MKNVRVGFFLLISQVVYVLFSILWIIVALMSFMMFDSSEALSDVQTLSIFVYVWLYPLAFIGALISSWVLYHKRKFRGAVWANLIPLLWVLPIIGIFAFNI